MHNAGKITGITHAMQLYFDGLYHADTNILAQVFHDEARYVNRTQQDHMNLSVSDYFDVVRTRTPPANTHEPRHDTIDMVTFGGTELAFVKARISMMGRDYLDFLTFVKTGETWKIMFKVFTYSPQKD